MAEPRIPCPVTYTSWGPGGGPGAPKTMIPGWCRSTPAMAARISGFSAPACGEKAGLAVAPQRDVQVHGASGQTLERLRYERGPGAGRPGQGAHGVLQAEAVVSRAERVWVPKTYATWADALRGAGRFHPVSGGWKAGQGVG